METANQSLSLLSLFMQATLPIKLVMLVLLGASVVSWAMIIRRARVYRQAEVQFQQLNTRSGPVSILAGCTAKAMTVPITAKSAAWKVFSVPVSRSSLACASSPVSRPMP